jgi:hypothetical protein
LVNEVQNQGPGVAAAAQPKSPRGRPRRAVLPAGGAIIKKRGRIFKYSQEFPE